jgi:hypothetical protein
MIVKIIQFIHLLIIFIVIISLFIPNYFVKKIVLIFLLYLCLQYILGYEKCGLTELEYLILGEKNHKEGFMYRLIKPMIKIPEKYFDDKLFILHITWIIILMYQIYLYKCKSNICNLNN